MHAIHDSVSLTPPQPPGMVRALTLALVAHALLLAALTWGVHWKQTESSAVEAEIWSSVTQQAAPRAVEPIAPTTPVTPPPPPPPQPEPRPLPKPAPKVEPPPPAPPVREADIALEREKKKRALEKEHQEELQEKLEAKREQVKKAAAEKKKQEQKEREKEKELEARREAQAEADAKRKADAAQAQKAQQQKQAEAQRLENIKRMQGMAGATGGATATGTAAQSSGPSSGYGGRVSAKVKPNIVFPDDIPGNPTADVEVRSSPDGTILSRRLVKSSGVKAWDDAVLKAIDKTETMPRDTDGRVPSPMIIGFSPKG